MSALRGKADITPDDAAPAYDSQAILGALEIPHCGNVCHQEPRSR